jgi:hypothetical protein
MDKNKGIPIRTAADYAEENVIAFQKNDDTGDEHLALLQRSAVQELSRSTDKQTRATFNLNEEVEFLGEALLPLRKSIDELKEQIEKLNLGGGDRRGVDGEGEGSFLGDLAKGIAVDLIKETVTGVAKSKKSSKSKKKSAKTGAKTAAKTESKTVTKSGTKAVKTGAKTAAKTGAKSASKSIVKKIPGIGAAVGLGFAIDRLMDGDVIGSILEATSGIASMLPIIGTTASVALDGVLAVKDMTADVAEVVADKKELDEKQASEIEARALQASDMVTPASTENMIEKQDKDAEESVALQEQQVSVLEKLLSAFEAGTESGGFFGGVGGAMSAAGSAASGWMERAGNYLAGNSGETVEGAVGLGATSAAFESGNRGSTAIGYDRGGGTSYGKYQLSSTQGSAQEYLKYLASSGTKEQKEFAAEMSKMNLDTGGTGGAAAEKWQAAAKSGILGNTEHEYIKKSHFDPAMRGLKKGGLSDMAQNSEAIQDMIWSGSVQHGAYGASSMANEVYKDGMTNEQFIKAYMERRKGKVSNAKLGDAVANSVKNVRYPAEERRLLAMEAAQKARVDTVAESKTEPQPVEVVDGKTGEPVVATANPVLTGSTVEAASVTQDFKSPAAMGQQASTPIQTPVVEPSGGSIASNSSAGDGSGSGPIPNGNYDKLTAVARGDLA